MIRKISPPRDPGTRFGDAAVTAVVLFVAYAAIDDITTDAAAGFRVEYTVLALCAAWLLFIAVRLLRAGHALLGGVTIAAVVASVWAQRAIGPGVVWGRGLPFRPEYPIAVIAYLWFCALSLVLLAHAWRHRARAAG
jgi:hypothetical protein